MVDELRFELQGNMAKRAREKLKCTRNPFDKQGWDEIEHATRHRSIEWSFKFAYLSLTVDFRGKSIKFLFAFPGRTFSSTNNNTSNMNHITLCVIPMSGCLPSTVRPFEEALDRVKSYIELKSNNEWEQGEQHVQVCIKISHSSGERKQKGSGVVSALWKWENPFEILNKLKHYFESIMRISTQKILLALDGRSVCADESRESSFVRQEPKWRRVFSSLQHVSSLSHLYNGL